MTTNRHRSLAIAVCLFLLPPSSFLLSQEVQWRHDYNAARREAQEKQRPLLLDFGTEDCFWCKRLDATTFRAPAIVGLLNERFIPLKVDGDRDKLLTETLNIQAFPTLVLAAPDGQMLAVHPGYINVVKLQEMLQRALTAAGPAARVPSAQELLNQAREAHAARQYLRCLDHCEAITVGYANLPEAVEARQLATAIKNQPEHLKQACDLLGERLANLYLELAEAWLKKGRPEQAVIYLERIVQTLPDTRQAAGAQDRLAQLRRN